MSVPKDGFLHKVGASPLSVFYQGVTRLSLEDCSSQLETAASRDFTINLRLYPMSNDVTGFLIVKSVAGRIVTNGLGSLHRLDSGLTRIICEVPRFSWRAILFGLVFFLGAITLALLPGFRPTDRVLLIAIALLFAAPAVRREYYRHVYAHELLAFVKIALSATPEYPLLP
jgi:hypothetical protein